MAKSAQITFGPKQCESFRFWEQPNRVSLLSGSVRSGKSLPALEGFLTWATATSDDEYLLVARDTRLLRKVVLKIVEKYALDANMSYSYNQMNAIVRVGGTTFHCATSNAEGAEAAIKGMTIRGAYIDELTEITESMFDMIQTRMATYPDGRIVATTNPDAPTHWVHKRLIDIAPTEDDEDDPEPTNVMFFTMHDNPIMTPEMIETESKRYSGVMRQRMIDGLWVSAEGLVYPVESYRIEAMPDSDPSQSVLSVDYGPDSVTHWSLWELHWDAEGGYVDPNATIDDLLAQKAPGGGVWWLAREGRWNAQRRGQITDLALGEHIAQWLGGQRPNSVLIDPAAQGFATTLQEQLGIAVDDASNAVLYGLDQTLVFLERDVLRINAGKATQYTQGELTSYRWDDEAAKKGERKPIKRDDHAMDCMRYFAYTLRYLIARLIKVKVQHAEPV